MPAAYKGLTIQLGADFHDVYSELRKLDSAAKDSTKQMRSIDAALKLDPTNVDLLAQKQQEAARQSENLRKRIELINAALESGEVEEGSQAWRELQRELNYAERDMRRAEQAAKDASSAAKSIGDAKGDVESVGTAAKNAAQGLEDLGDKAKVASGAVAATAGAAFKSFTDWDGAIGSLQSSLGVTREEAERLSDVGKGIYEDGWGDSIEGVTSSLSYAKQLLGDINDADLSTVVTTSLMLEKQGSDYNETLRGARVLIEDFGMSAQGAMDLMVSATQDGLNWTDELGDNISEYAPRWADAGVSAEDYFSLLKAGADNGAYSLDKVGDYLNEFLTSLSDGRMDEAMEGFSKSTRDVFDAWKAGKADAADVLDAVISELEKMPSEYDRMSAASQMWSSLGEDNCMDMILALGDVENAYGDVAGTASTAVDDASQGWQDLIASGRKLMDSLAPIGGKLAEVVDTAADAADEFSEWFEGLDENGQDAVITIGAIVAAAGPMLSIGGKVAGGIGTMVEALGGVGGSTKTLETEAAKGKKAVDGLNDSFGLSPARVAIWAGALSAAAISGRELAMEFAGGNEALSTANERLDEGAQKAYEYAESLLSVDQNGDGVVDSLDAAAKALETTEEQFSKGRGIASGFEKQMDAVKEESQGLGGVLNDVYGKTEYDVKSALSRITDAHSLAWASMLAATAAEGGKIDDESKAVMEGLLQSVEGLPPAYESAGTDAMRALAASMATMWPELAEYSSMSSDEIAAIIKERLHLGLSNQDGVMASAAGSMAEQLAQGLSAAANGEELDQASRDTVSAYVGGLRESLAMSPEMAEVATQSARNLAAGLAEQWPELANYGDMTGTQILDAIELRLSGMYGEGYSASVDLGSGISDGTPTARSASEALAASVESGVVDTPEFMRSKGSSAGSGFGSGLSSQTGSAKAGGESLADSAARGMDSLDADGIADSKGRTFLDGISSWISKAGEAISGFFTTLPKNVVVSGGSPTSQSSYSSRIAEPMRLQSPAALMSQEPIASPFAEYAASPLAEAPSSSFSVPSIKASGPVDVRVSNGGGTDGEAIVGAIEEIRGDLAKIRRAIPDSMELDEFDVARLIRRHI